MSARTFMGINITPAGANASGIRWHAFGPDGGQLRADTLEGMRQLIRDASPRDKFKTKRGRLTRYALACGYLEKAPLGAVLSVPSPSAGLILVQSANGSELYRGRDLKTARGIFDNAHRLPLRDDVERVTYHRPPTAGEVRFGYGATHYADFTPDECCIPGTRIAKRWMVSPFDGLRYYR